MADRLSRQASETYPVHIAGSQWYDRCDRQEVEVPLSDNEQRLLEQMERALYAEDPKFATSLRGADPRTHHRRRVVKASVGFLAGIALLIVGLVTVWAVSIVGFLLMLASLFLAASSMRQLNSAPDLTIVGSTGPAGPRSGTPRPRTRKAKAGRGGLMNRFEERWNKRREDDGRDGR